MALIAAVLFPVWHGVANLAVAQGYAPQEAVPHMTVVRGFEVSMFASEPAVRQCILVKFDDRGRLWTIQYLQYPNPAGLKRIAVNRRYHRHEVAAAVGIPRIVNVDSCPRSTR